MNLGTRMTEGACGDSPYFVFFFSRGIGTPAKICGQLMESFTNFKMFDFHKKLDLMNQKLS